MRKGYNIGDNRGEKMKKILLTLLFILTNISTSFASFGFENVIKQAEALSQSPYQTNLEKLPDALANMNYDDFRGLRYIREQGPWYGKKLPFEIQFFHLGSIFTKPVKIHQITNSESTNIPYNPNAFTQNNQPLQSFPDIGYAGFRLHYPLNTAKYHDELVTFLGASYFRALGKGQKYGLSARGLAVDTGLISGEEFPEFTEFFITQPNRRSKSITIYALLNSPRISGAYQFIIYPGKITKMDVTAQLFPRAEIQKIGIAPLTSMYLFGENTKNKFYDYRPEVHDSDGLLVWNGNDEQIWRPLDNNKKLRISSFVDNNPKGFGLLQRDTDANHYQDFEAFYQDRPSVWVEPIEPFGDGSIELVEIPSDKEIHDNIVAMFVPKEKLKPQHQYTFKYRLSWFKNEQPFKSNLAQIVATNVGIGGVSGVPMPGETKFAIDFKGKELTKIKNPQDIIPMVEATEGKIKNIVLVKNPLIGGYRLFFDFIPKGNVSELRASLKLNDKSISELWSYQWLE